MKKLKKLTGLLLALVMIMSMAMTVCAASELSAGETMSVANHTFKAYQIFKGEHKENDAYPHLYEPEWGSGVNADALLADLKENGDKFDECVTAFDVTEVLGNFGDYSDDARDFALLAYENRIGDGITVVDGQDPSEAGLYLVVDVTEFKEGDTNTYKNLALLQLTKDGTFDIDSKVDIPSVEKKVQDINDSTESKLTDLQDSADYDIGDDVPFTLIGTLPSRLTDYKTYKYIFHDTLSKGLTYNGNAQVFAVNGRVETDITKYFNVSTNAKGENGDVEITVSTNNIFNARAIAEIYSTTKIIVRYTAKLNENAAFGYVGNPNTVYLEYSNNPNESGEGDNETGNTPEDKVVVFTYKLNVSKTDSKKEPLKGAGFTLYKKLVTDEEKVIKVIEAGEDTLFTFEGLDGGHYILRETTVPEGYNPADDLEFIISADHDELSDDPQLTKLETNKSVITIEMTQSNAYYTGVLATTVVNNEGQVLPETGGMGTTIFYVVGAILVIGAAVIMITRKRMSK